MIRSRKINWSILSENNAWKLVRSNDFVNCNSPVICNQSSMVSAALVWFITTLNKIVSNSRQTHFMISYYNQAFFVRPVLSYLKNISFKQKTDGFIAQFLIILFQSFSN